MKTYTTTEAIEKLGGISRPTFSRWVKRYDLKVAKIGVGRGRQSEWEAKNIDNLARALNLLEAQGELIVTKAGE